MTLTCHHFSKENEKMGKIIEIEQTNLRDVFLFECIKHGDDRGFFTETYNKNDYASVGLMQPFVQDNYSYSSDVYTLRGLHFQVDPCAVTKIVRCSKGAALDIIVDIRRGSPTYMQHGWFELSAERCNQIVVPAGFAHGVLTTEPDTELFYKMDGVYDSETDRAINIFDPYLGIKIPFNLTKDDLCMSEKDINAPLYSDSDANFIFKGV